MVCRARWRFSALTVSYRKSAVSHARSPSSDRGGQFDIAICDILLISLRRAARFHTAVRPDSEIGLATSGRRDRWSGRPQRERQRNGGSSRTPSGQTVPFGNCDLCCWLTGTIGSEYLA